MEFTPITPIASTLSEPTSLSLASPLSSDHLLGSTPVKEPLLPSLPPLNLATELGDRPLGTELWPSAWLGGALAGGNWDSWGGSLPDDGFDPLTGRSIDQSLVGFAPQELVFIDQDVTGSGTLLSGLAPNARAIFLDQTQDGIQQISQALSQFQDISAIHLVGHGDQGGLKLGSTWLTQDNLTIYQSDLADWAKSLTADADLLLYGCKVAAGELGIDLIQALSQITGADVAASDDLTGSLELGGDWVLEATTGQIEASLAFEGDAIAHYDDILLRTFTGSADPNAPTVFTLTAAELNEDFVISGNVTLQMQADTLDNRDFRFSQSITGDGNDTTIDKLTIVATDKVAAGDFDNISPDYGEAEGDIVLTGSAIGGNGLVDVTLQAVNSIQLGSQVANNVTTQTSINVSGKIALKVEDTDVIVGVQPLPFGFSNRSVNLSLTGASLTGSQVTIDAIAQDYNPLRELPSAVERFVIQPFVQQLPAGLFGSLVLPVTVDVRSSTATLTLTDTTITATGAVAINSKAVVDASVDAISTINSINPLSNITSHVAIGYGQAAGNAQTQILGSSQITSGDSVTVAATTKNTTKVTARVFGNVNLGTETANLNEGGGSLAIANTSTTAKTLIDTNAVINALGNVSVNSSGKVTSDAKSVTAVFVNGSAAIGLGLNLDQTTIDTTVNGRITAGSAAIGQSLNLNGVNSNQDTVTIANHGWATGDQIVYDNGGGTSIGGLTNGETYTVVVVDANTVKLAKGTALDLDNTGLNAGVQHSLTPQDGFSFNPDTAINVTTNEITQANHGLTTGQAVTYLSDGNEIGSLTSQATYYVVVTGTNSFKLASTLDRAAAGIADIDFETGALGGRSRDFDPLTNIDAAQDTIQLQGHGLRTGQEVVYFSDVDGTPVNGLSDRGKYYVIVEDADTIQLASSRQQALNGQADVLFSAGSLGSGSNHAFTPTSNALEFNPVTDINATTNTITLADHGFVTGAEVTYTSGGNASASSLTPATPYYVIVVDADTIKLASTVEKAIANQADVDLTAGQVGNITGHALNPVMPDHSLIHLDLNPRTQSFNASSATTVDLATSRITIANHGLAPGQIVNYQSAGGTAISGLQNRGYFAIVVDDNTIQLANTFKDAYDGKAIDFKAVTVIPNTTLVKDGSKVYRYIGQSAQTVLLGSQTYTNTSLWQEDTTINATTFVANPSANQYLSNFAGSLGTLAGTTLHTLTFAERSHLFDPTSNTVVKNGADSLTFATAHGFETGDKVFYEVDPTFSTPTVLKVNQTFDPVGDVDLVNNTIDLGSHQLQTGDRVTYLFGYSGGTEQAIATQTGTLQKNQTYYAIRVDGGKIQLASSLSDAQAGIALDLQAGAAGQQHNFQTERNVTAYDAPLKSLDDSTYYYVIKVDDNTIQLVETLADTETARAIDLNAATATGTNHRLIKPNEAAGLKVDATLDAKDVVSVKGSTGSNPKIRDLIANPDLALIAPAIFNPTFTKDLLKTKTEGTNSISFGVGIGVNVFLHDVYARVGSTARLQSAGDLQVTTAISQVFQTIVDSATGKDEGGKAIATSIGVGYYKNTSRALVYDGAELDASGRLSVTSKVDYPFFFGKNFVIPDDRSSKDYQDRVGNLVAFFGVDVLLGGKLGLDRMFNSFVTTKNKGKKLTAQDELDKKGKKGQLAGGDIGLAFAIDAQVYNNTSEAIVGYRETGDLSAIRGVKINQDTQYRRDTQTLLVDARTDMILLNATGIINLDLAIDVAVKAGGSSGNSAKKLKPKSADLSEVFSIFGNRAKNGLGVSVIAGVMDNTTRALINPGALIHTGTIGDLALDPKQQKKQSLVVTATEKLLAFELAQGGGEAEGYGFTGSAIGVDQTSTTIAQIASGVTIDSGSLLVNAQSENTRINLVGSIQKSGTLSAGVGVGVNLIERDTKAILGREITESDGTAGTAALDISANGDIDLQAANTGNLVIVGIAGALTADPPEPDNADPSPSTFDITLAGSVAVQNVQDTALAYINAPGTVDALNSGDLLISAKNDTLVLTLAGGFAFSTGTNATGSQTSLGLFGAYARNDGTLTTQAFIQGTQVGTDALSLSAVQAGELVTATVGLAGAKTQAATAISANIAGSLSQNSVRMTTEAYLQDAAIAARNTISLSADNKAELYAIAGAFSLGLTTATGPGTSATATVGFSVATNDVLQQTTRTYIATSTGQTRIISTAGDLTLNATARAKIFALSLAGSFSSTSSPAGNALSLAGAGAGSRNKVTSDISAFIQNTTVDVKTPGKQLSLTAKDEETDILAIGGALAGALALTGTSSIAGSVGISAGVNEITNGVKAYIDGGIVTSAGAISLQALSTATITSVTVGGAVSVAQGTSNSVAVAATGAGSGNTIRNTVQATVKNRAKVQGAGTIGLKAEDKSSILAAAIGASVAVSGGAGSGISLAIGISAAENLIDNTVTASIENAEFGSWLANVPTDVNLQALSTGTTKAYAVAASIAVSTGTQSALAFSGGGAGATNAILTRTNAFVKDSTQVSALRHLSATAENTATIEAGIAAVSGSLGGAAASIGAAIARNYIGYDKSGDLSYDDNGNPIRGEVQAFLSNTSLVLDGDLTLTAESQGSISASVGAGSVAVSLSSNIGLGLSGAGVSTDNKIDLGIRAFIDGDGATGIQARAIALTADDTSAISARAGAASLAVASGQGGSGALSIGVALARNEVTNNVEAYVKDANQRLKTTVGDVVLSANSRGKELFDLTVANVSDFTAKLDDAAIADKDDPDTQATDEKATDAAADTLFLESLRTAFSQQGITLNSTDRIGITTLELGQEWSVLDGDTTYVIQRVGTSLKVFKTTIEAVSVAASVAVGFSSGPAGIAISGAGAESTNLVSTKTNAYAKDSVIESADDVTLTAGNTAGIIAKVAGVSVAAGIGTGGAGVGASIGVGVARNLIGWEVDSSRATTYTSQSDLPQQLQRGNTVKITAGARTGDIYEYVGDPVQTYKYTTSSGSVNLQTDDRVKVPETYTGGGQPYGIYRFKGSATQLDLANQDYSDESRWVLVTDAGLASQDYSDSSRWKQINLEETPLEVQAYLSNVSVQAGGDLIQAANAAASIDAGVGAGSAAIAGGGKAGVGLSGSGASAENVIATQVQAFIDRDRTAGIQADSVSLTATDESAIKAMVVGLSIAGAFGGLAGVAGSIGVSLARNTISNEVGTYILNADQGVLARDGGVQLQARENARIDATSVAASLAVGIGGKVGVALSGAGAEGTNIINNTVKSYIVGSTVNTANARYTSQQSPLELLQGDRVRTGNGDVYEFLGASITNPVAAINLSGEAYSNTARWKRIDHDVVLDAQNTSAIKSLVGSVSAAVSGGLVAAAGSLGVSLARNLIGLDGLNDSTGYRNQVLAYLDQSTVDTSGDLQVLAQATETIDTYAFSGSGAVAIGIGGAVAGSGAEATSKTRSQVNAYLNNSSVLAADDLIVKAIADTQVTRSKADGVAIAIGLGALSVGSSVIVNDLQNRVEASISSTSAKQAIAGGNLTVLADVTNAKITNVVAVAPSIAIGGLALSGAGIDIQNTIANQVTAKVTGPMTLRSLGKVDVRAEETAFITGAATAVAISVAGGGVAASLGVSLVKNEIRSSIQASIDNDPNQVWTSGTPLSTQVTATDISVTADSSARIEETQAIAVAVAAAALGLAASGSRAEANIKTLVNANVEGASLTATEDVEVAARANNKARTSANGGALGALAIGGMDSKLVLGRGTGVDEVVATLGNGTTVNAAGLRITADSTDDLLAESVAAGAGAISAIGSQSTVTNDLATLAKIGTGATVTVDAVYLSSVHRQDTDASADAYSFALLSGSGAGVKQQISSKANVDIGSNSTVTAENITITALNTLTKDEYKDGHSLRSGSASFAGIQALVSETLVGDASNPFTAKVNIGSGARLTALGTNQQPGLLEIEASNEITAYDNVLLETVSGYSISAAVSRIKTNTIAEINLDGATLENKSGDVSLATRTTTSNRPSTNLFVVGVVSGAGSEATAETIAANQITAKDATIKGSNVSLYAGRNSFGVPNLMDAYATTESTTAALASISVPLPKATISETNKVDLQGTTKLQALEDVNLVAKESPGGDTRATTNGLVLNLSLIPYGFDVPDGGSVTSSNQVNLGNQVTVEAGLNSASLVQILPLKVGGSFQMGPGNVRVVDNTVMGQELTVAEKQALGLPDNIKYEYEALNLDDITFNVSTGTIVQSGNTFYSYRPITDESAKIVLDEENYSDTSKWSTITPTFDLSQVSGNNVSLNRNNLVRTAEGAWYLYKGANQTGVNLVSQNFNDAANWVEIPFYQSNQAEAFKTNLNGKFYVIKPVELESPRVNYVNIGNLLLDQREKVLDWMASHAGNAEAIARYQVQLDQINDTLEDLGLIETVANPTNPNQTVTAVKRELDSLFVELPDIYAAPGSIFIEASGADASSYTAKLGTQLLTRAGAQIDLLNKTPFALSVNDVVIRDNKRINVVNGSYTVFEPGKVYVNNGQVPGQTTATASNDKTIAIRQRAFAQSEYDLGNLPSSVVNQMFGLSQDLYVTGDVVNEAGTVVLQNFEGSINVTGEIRAETVTINAANDFNLNAPDWLHTNQDPRQYLDYDALRAAAFAGGSGTTLTYADPTNVRGLNLDTAIKRNESAILAQGAIAVTARYLNINGLIQSGVDKVTLHIDSTFNPGQTTQDLLDDQGRPLPGISFGADGVPVNAYFDAAKQAIVVDDIIPKGGQITLAGQILSTGNGRLKVANGYTSVDIDNNTNYELILNRIDTTTNRQGKITIIDTINPTTPKKVEYTLDATGVRQQTSFGALVAGNTTTNTPPSIAYTPSTDPNLTKTYTSGQQPIYQPTPGLHYIWTEGQEKTEVERRKYETNSFNLFGDNGLADLLAADDSYKWNEITYRDQQPLLESESVELVNAASPLSDRVPDYATNQAYTLQYALQDDATVDLKPGVTEVRDLATNLVYRYKASAPLADKLLSAIDYATDTNWEVLNGGVAVTGSFQNITQNKFDDSYRNYNYQIETWTTGGGWLRKKTIHELVTITKGLKDFYTHTLKADHDIQIQFQPGPTTPEIKVETEQRLSLKGNIESPSQGIITLTSKQGSIIGDTAIAIYGVGPSLYAGAGAEDQITVNVEGNKGPVTAKAGGNIQVTAVSRDNLTSVLEVGQIESGLGNVYLNAANGITANDAPGAVAYVKGDRIELYAAEGAIGSSTRPLQIDSNQLGRGGFAAKAKGNIDVVEQLGDLKFLRPTLWDGVASVQSTEGDVTLTNADVTGSMRDGIDELFRPVNAISNSPISTQQATPATFSDAYRQYPLSPSLYGTLFGQGNFLGLPQPISTPIETPNVMGRQVTLKAGRTTGQLGRVSDPVSINLSQGYAALATADKELLSLAVAEDVVGVAYALYTYTGSGATLDLKQANFSDTSQWQKLNPDVVTNVRRTAQSVNLTAGQTVLVQYSSQEYGLYKYLGGATPLDLAQQNFANTSRWQFLTPKAGTDANAPVALSTGNLVANKAVVERLALQLREDIDLEATAAVTIEAGNQSTAGVAVQTTGSLQLHHVQAGGEVRLQAEGAITDLYTDGTAAISTFGDLLLRLNNLIQGPNNSPLRIQVGQSGRLSADAPLGNINLKQVAADLTLNGVTQQIANLFVERVNSEASPGASVAIEVTEGDLIIGKIVAGNTITLKAQDDIFDAFEDGDATILNTVTGPVVAPATGDVYLQAGDQIGSSTNFFDVSIQNGSLEALAGTDIFLYSTRDLNLRSVTSTAGNVTLDVEGHARVKQITATQGTVNLDAAQSIIDANNNGDANIVAKSLNLKAAAGEIGNDLNPFEIDSSNASNGTVAAVADQTIHLVETTGDLRVNRIQSQTASVTLKTNAGSIIDANNDALVDVTGTTINLVATDGSIGQVNNDLEINTATPAPGKVNAIATHSIYLTETAAGLDVGTVTATTGDIRLTVQETAATGEDLLIDGNASVTALGGSVLLRAGDNVTLQPNGLISAAQSITILGDSGNADPGIGSTLTLEGRIRSTQGFQTHNVTIQGESDADVITLKLQELVGNTQVLGGGSTDQITVNQLPSLDLGDRNLPTRDQLTLDGQSGDDTYTITITGGSTDYRINVFDTGVNDQDQLTIWGTAGADEFLLRASQKEFAEGGVAFVAALHGATNGNPNTLTERINYTKNLESLVLDTVEGDDRITLDDNWTRTTVRGGLGQDSFQVGQIFKSERDALAGVAAEDTFATVQTTRGYLSNGVSYTTTLEGGDDNDQFTVFRNRAELNLNGDNGDDLFVIRAFAEEGSSDSNVTAGDGADQVQYVTNAPVNVNGGDGNDTLRVIGTEFADRFVVTNTAIIGAGRTINYTAVETVEVDGAEGNDEFYVLSTSSDVVTKLFGGLGNDYFSLGGDAKSVVAGTNSLPAAEGPHDVQGIQGQLFINGFSGDGSTGGLGDPVLLPGETNLLTSTGAVLGFSGTGTGAAIDQMTVTTADLLGIVSALTELVGKTLEISRGNGLRRFWQITGVTDNGTGTTTLTLLNPTLTAAEWAAAGLPNAQSEYTINNLSPNFFVDETKTQDRVTVFDDGSTIGETGTLTANTLTGLGLGASGVTYNNFEIVEVLLGQGDDQFTIQNTADGAITAVHGGGGSDTVTALDRGGVDSRGLEASLVILGDTTEDGTRYTDTSTVANPQFARSFTNPGNDIIDASAMTEHVVIYGGAGNDQIQGSQAGDHLAGGAGDDRISGLGGDDHIYGDSGFNLDLATRELTVPTTELAGADRLDGGAGDDILLGDHGVIEQVPGTQRILTTGQVTRIYTNEFTNGADDQIEGGSGKDRILAGNGNDTVTDSQGNDIVLGDHGRVDYDLEGDGSDRDLDLITATAFTIGGQDVIDTGSGNDIAIAGTASDQVSGGDGNDLIFGDHGEVAGTIDANLLPLDQPVHPFRFTSIATQTTEGGGADDLSGNAGDDIVIGGQDNDILRGNDGDDDLIGGHNVADGQDRDDTIDGGAGNDAIAGDNATILRKGDAISSRFRTLSGPVIYDANGVAQVTSPAQANPRGASERVITLLNHQDAPLPGTFGNDFIAGGAQDDTILGQLGNDTIQGDGSITLGGLTLSASVEDWAGSGTDGDDYIEGNGGDDRIFGNLGQDDLIGGSSNLFGLTAPNQRPDGADQIYGGAGTRIARNDLGDASPNGHARDADVILGDNGNLFRLLGASGQPLTFTYDNYGTLKIVPRAIQALDYTDGGGASDRGTADLLHGEAGDDVIRGMTGNDVIFGEGQDDDLYGGTGSDRLYGGAGEDGIVGDDGQIYTSRNGLTETLYGLTTPNLETNYALPGPFTGFWGFVAGRLQKTVDLTAWSVGGNDIIYGGLGDDFIHAGSGDDAVSGAEAQSSFYNTLPQTNLNPLQYDPVTRKFAAYDANNPMGRINNFLLNFDAVDAAGNKINDGKDRLFGDLGNDWLVGGTQNDRLFGGLGDDLMNADDNLETAGGLNNQPDAVEFADRDFAFGGGGLDVLIANTGGDRLFDWSGEFNSYWTPFSPFGSPTVVRSPSPAIEQFLRNLGRESGADQSLTEPNGELGLITPQDPEWQSQHGGPRDPQPGNSNASRDTQGGPEDDRAAGLSLAGGVTSAPAPVLAASLVNSQDVTVNRIYVDQDPSDSTKLALFVGGTTGSDVIEVKRGSSTSQIRVLVNGVNRGEFARTQNGATIGRVIIYGHAGDDQITVNGDLDPIATVIYGGSGNDTLRGGLGSNLLDGGLGNDHLFGSGVRDLLIGGLGQDTLSGDQGDDLLIGGTYSYSEDLGAIAALMVGWNSSLSYSQRTNNLKTGVGIDPIIALTANTVVDDQAADTLNGLQQQDWFWAFSLDDTDDRGTEVLG